MKPFVIKHNSILFKVCKFAVSDFPHGEWNICSLFGSLSMAGLAFVLLFFLAGVLLFMAIGMVLSLFLWPAFYFMYDVNLLTNIDPGTVILASHGYSPFFTEWIRGGLIFNLVLGIGSLLCISTITVAKTSSKILKVFCKPVEIERNDWSENE